MRAVTFLLIGAAVAALALVPLVAPPFYANLLIPFFGYSIALLGFNLLFGYTGRQSLQAYGASGISRSC
jgi:branched-chain amino acid transport system permease protein